MADAHRARCGVVNEVWPLGVVGREHRLQKGWATFAVILLCSAEKCFVGPALF
jgi:hypothetical protein